MLSLISPYLAALVALRLQASAVLAVVVAGFIVAWRIHRIDARSRGPLYEVWDQISFLLNGFSFVFIGLDPNTEFLDGQVELDSRGFIVTSDTFETSIAGVFAAGDVRERSTKQLGAAVGEGVAALLQVRAYLQKHGHLGRREAA